MGVYRCTTTISRDVSVFFFNGPPTTAIYALSLHDALPICLISLFDDELSKLKRTQLPALRRRIGVVFQEFRLLRSEEHTSELQSQSKLVCRLLLEKKTWRSSHISWTSSTLPFLTSLTSCSH